MAEEDGLAEEAPHEEDKSLFNFLDWLRDFLNYLRKIGCEENVIEAYRLIALKASFTDGVKVRIGNSDKDKDPQQEFYFNVTLSRTSEEMKPFPILAFVWLMALNLSPDFGFGQSFSLRKDQP